jgi:riboflavin kinase / FMN adenylyltransferase
LHFVLPISFVIRLLRGAALRGHSPAAWRSFTRSFVISTSFVISVLKILRSISELPQLPGPLFLAIGVFDGVHRGHQAVISTSAQHAYSANGTPVVVTFDPHPAKILRPNDAPHLLTATQHKLSLIRQLGVAHLLVIDFNREFAATPPEEFVAQLVTNSNPLREICVGHEWSFGRNRAGNLDLLKTLGARFSFDVVGIPPVSVNGNVVSSTAIRQAVEVGDFAKAAEMLGRDYTILGTVVHGEAVGNKIGFPTANLSAHSEQFPPNGVYFAEARIKEVRHHGVINLGVRPTVARGKPQRTLEIHLLDFDKNIYGEDVEVRFLKYLRPEQKFGSVDALKAQIETDVKQARALCAT